MYELGRFYLFNLTLERGYFADTAAGSYLSETLARVYSSNASGFESRLTQINQYDTEDIIIKYERTNNYTMEEGEAARALKATKRRVKLLREAIEELRKLGKITEPADE